MTNLKELRVFWEKFGNYIIILILFISIFVLVSLFLSPSNLSLILVVLFLIVRFKERFFGLEFESKWTKGVCYLGLGAVILLAIHEHKTGDVSILYYTATMCIIESLDLFFEFIKTNILKKTM